MNALMPASPQEAASKFHNMSIKDLAGVMLNNAEAMSKLKVENTEISNEIARRLHNEIEVAFTEKKKMSGQVTIKADDIKIEAEIKKDVKWDSNKLLAVTAQMPFDKVSRMFKVELSMTESMYSALEAADEELFKRVTEARTVKFSPVTIKPKKD